MKNIILCEGSTDYVLLQYFMRKVYGWGDKGKSNEKSNSRYFKSVRTMMKESDSLSIRGCGGAKNLLPGFQYMVEYNNLSSESEAFDRIVILTDRDDAGTEAEFSKNVEDILNEGNVRIDTNVCNDCWVECYYHNGHGKEMRFQLLLLVVPFEDTGAMETFLLEAVSKKDNYDAEIITKGNAFIDGVDSEKRYLSKRRYITKAKFDVYFSVRTAATQFVERQDILKNVEWEEYAALQTGFAKLGDL